jgi:hypothetical protein
MARERELNRSLGSTIPDEWYQIRSRLEETEKSIADLMARGWKEFHQEVESNPSVYVSVLLEPASVDLCFELLELLGFSPPPTQGTTQGFVYRENLSAPVAKALEALLATGSPEQKLAVFESVAKTVADPWVETTCAQFLNEADPRLLATGLGWMNFEKALDRHLDAIKACWKRTSDWSVMETLVGALGAADTPEGRAMYWDFARELLERAAGRPTSIFPSGIRVFFHRPPRPEEEEQYAVLAAQALKCKFDMDSRAEFFTVLEGTLKLPLLKALRILDQARPSLDPVLGTAVGVMADQIRAGETRPKSLLQAFGSALPLPKGD